MKKLFLLGIAALTLLTGMSHAANPIVVIETSMGNIKVELFEDKAPITVKNFLSYVDEKFYDGTLFHRVMGKENSDKDFMIQGGGLEPGPKGLKEKPTKEPIVNESSNGLSNQRAMVSMARRDQPNSATSQFFINVADNPFLDKKNYRDGVGYCVFGKVLEGMDVVDKIKAVKTEPRPPHKNVPVEDIVIKTVKREAAKPGVIPPAR